MIWSHEAILSLYPNVLVIREEIPYDAEDNVIEIDEVAVQNKAAELEAKYNAEQQTKVNARQSALNKLMALGLTEEEALALGVK